jgi:hypothetical protein
LGAFPSTRARGTSGGEASPGDPSSSGLEGIEHDPPAKRVHGLPSLTAILAHRNPVFVDNADGRLQKRDIQASEIQASDFRVTLCTAPNQGHLPLMSLMGQCDKPGTGGERTWPGERYFLYEILIFLCPERIGFEHGAACRRTLPPDRQARPTALPGRRPPQPRRGRADGG